MEVRDVRDNIAGNGMILAAASVFHRNCSTGQAAKGKDSLYDKVPTGLGAKACRSSKR